MLWSLICFGAGWWVGRNWDLVKRKYREKVKPALRSAGKATKIE